MKNVFEQLRAGEDSYGVAFQDVESYLKQVDHRE